MGWLYWTVFVFIVAYFTGFSVGKSGVIKKLLQEMIDYGLIGQSGISGMVEPEVVISRIITLINYAAEKQKEVEKYLEDGLREQEAELAKTRQEQDDELSKTRKEQEAILEQREMCIAKGERENVETKQQLTLEKEEIEDVKQEIEDIRYKLELEKEEFNVLMYNAEEDGTLDSMYKKMYATGIDIGNKVSDEIKTELTMLDLQETEFIKQYQEDKTPQFKRLSKIIIGSFNTEVKMMLKDMKYSNRDKVKANIVKLYSTTNKKLNGVIMFAASETQYWNTLVKKKGEQESYRFFSDYTIPTELLEIKLKQVDLTSAYLLQKEVEDDKRREELKIIREQAQEEKELKAELDKLEKEETHYEQQIKKMEQYAIKAPDDVQRLEYEGRIKELEQQLAGVQEAKVDVESKTFNNKAGYVYIISNEGSLGKGVVKIGVTRRLEPMDRVKELSGASVPFEYAVNAFIFSQDAFSTESQLHQQFREYEVNKVNHQKEFFRVSLEQIEDYVKQEIDPTINFNMESHSEQYLETLRIMQEEGANTEVIL